MSPPIKNGTTNLFFFVEIKFESFPISTPRISSKKSVILFETKFILSSNGMSFVFANTGNFKFLSKKIFLESTLNPFSAKFFFTLNS